MKQCSCCKQFKPETEFYADKRTPDGLKAQCKLCHTEGSIRTRDPEKHRVSNRLFMREDRTANAEKYRERERIAAQKRPWDEKREARYQLNLAVRRGEVVKPTVCECCQQKKKLTAHHNDYSKPLEVEWLCYECHGNK